VGTASTKSRSRKRKTGKQKTPTSSVSPVQAAVPPNEAPAGVEISKRTWFIASAAILVVAAFLRLYDLNLVPLHHDEGVNGNFLVRLVREGYYHYDPANYHGPTLYYFAAVFPWILSLFGANAQTKYGLTTVAIRCVPALFGIATIGLIFTLRRNLGTIATLSAAFLLAVSPGAVYLSRYFIHETLFVFFTLGIVVAAVKYYENPHPVYLILGALSAGLLFATKETAMISAAVLVIALGLTIVYRWLWQESLGGRRGPKKKKGRADREGEVDYRTFVERAGGPTKLTLWLVSAFAIFIAVNVLFYASFFLHYPKELMCEGWPAKLCGVHDAIETFKFWTKTGKEAHVHPFSTYFWWLLLQESPLLVLGTIGAALAVLKPTKAFALFAALWAFGLMAAYSLIAYKTPWLSLSFILPLALTSGVAIEWVYEALGRFGIDKRVRGYAVAALLLTAIGLFPGLARIFDQVVSPNPWPGLVKALGQAKLHPKTFIPGYQTIDLNFLNYDNDDRYYVYVYAHTRREALKLVDEIDRLAERTHQGYETGITLVSPEYWPLPWYLRDYKRVGYFGHMSPSTEPIIIARQDQAAEVQATFGDRYQQIQSGFNTAGSFPLRPGVDLLLYARRELVH
jgi:uncharacterized protein (TIGR03663 family)